MIFVCVPEFGGTESRCAFSNLDMDDEELAEAVGDLEFFGRTLQGGTDSRSVQLALPVGLKNLGNTCYMNATLQVLRAIPELQTALTGYVEFHRSPKLADQSCSSGSGSGLPAHLGQLFTSMSRTTDAFIPQQFLASLRQDFPQFAELAGAGGGAKPTLGPGYSPYAQQGDHRFYRQFNAPFWTIPNLFF